MAARNANVDPRIAAVDDRLFRAEVASILHLKRVYGVSDADTLLLIDAARDTVYNEDTALGYLISLTQFERLRERILEKYRREE